MVLLVDLFVQVIVQIQLVKVDHRSAAAAYKVAVGGDIGVKAFLAIDHTNTFYNALLLEEDQIPVNGTQA